MEGTHYINFCINDLFFGFRVNLKYLSEETVNCFYNNFNYGILFHQQLQTTLQIISHKKINGSDSSFSVDNIQKFLETKLPDAWNHITKCTNQILDFSDQSIKVSMNQQLTTTLHERTQWVNNHGPSTLVDFRTPVVGEDFEDMIITSDSENEDDSSDEEIEI